MTDPQLIFDGLITIGLFYCMVLLAADHVIKQRKLREEHWNYLGLKTDFDHFEKRAKEKLNMLEERSCFDARAFERFQDALRMIEKNTVADDIAIQEICSRPITNL